MALDVVISFDTTGSMYPALSTVRQNVNNFVKQLLTDMKDVRISVIAHGDYCDKNIYITKKLDFTSDINALSYFIKNVERTNGGDYPECYEYVFKIVSELDYRPDAKKLYIMIADAVPHDINTSQLRLDWRKELKSCVSNGISVTAIQALPYKSDSTWFYKEISKITGGFHLVLDQFNDTETLIVASIFQHASTNTNNYLEQYEQDLISKGRMNRSVSRTFDQLLKRNPTTGRFQSHAKTVDEGRFQFLKVDNDCAIKGFVESQGIPFKKGSGYYEFTKRETIQSYKQIILLDTETGHMYEGSSVREVLGLPEYGDIRLSPTFDNKKYKVFVQSTSVNRALKAGTMFLYETV